MMKDPSSPSACGALSGFGLASLFSLLLLASVASDVGAQATAPTLLPNSIASINLCTDQHVLSLASPDQIKGLSPFARDAGRSWLAKQAANYPVLSGLAEDILVLSPDLVVAGRFSRRQTRELLKARGVRVEEFDVVDSIEDAKQQILRFGTLAGRPDAAAREVAAIESAVGRARAATAKKPATALSVQRRGWVSGERTLTTSLLETVGLKNAATGPGLRYGRLMSLEAIIALRPDFLIVTRDDKLAEDQGRAMLLHPAITGLYPRERMIVLPESLTVCGGPMLVEALDRLAAQVRNLPER